jgi:hypothetical protein
MGVFSTIDMGERGGNKDPSKHVLSPLYMEWVWSIINTLKGQRMMIGDVTII